MAKFEPRSVGTGTGLTCGARGQRGRDLGSKVEHRVTHAGNRHQDVAPGARVEHVLNRLRPRAKTRSRVTHFPAGQRQRGPRAPQVVGRSDSRRFFDGFEGRRGGGRGIELEGRPREVGQRGSEPEVGLAGSNDGPLTDLGALFQVSREGEHRAERSLYRQLRFGVAELRQFYRLAAHPTPVF